ncbi:unnamed protein product [Periconia digitata]|uniref:Uncharacterized protein n=1 Tax=Periconia digitata TaxID=1303443 RepID=A0A9W4UQU2_9PLEO|nr:unnamed protein product [Periconia digitata]
MKRSICSVMADPAGFYPSREQSSSCRPTPPPPYAPVTTFHLELRICSSTLWTSPSPWSSGLISWFRGNSYCPTS